MKNIDEISRLSADDLEQIGQDASVQVPEDFRVRLPRRNRAVWAVAASVAILLGVGLWALPKPPKDTFDDPYLAYEAEHGGGDVDRLHARKVGVLGVDGPAILGDGGDAHCEQYQYYV